MCTGYSHHALSLREVTEHLRTLLDAEALLHKVAILGMVGRHGRRVDHNRRLRVAHLHGNRLHGLFVVNLGPLLLQLCRQTGRGAVVTRHATPLMEEVTRQGTHADTADTQKVVMHLLHHAIQSISKFHPQYPPQPAGEPGAPGSRSSPAGPFRRRAGGAPPLPPCRDTPDRPPSPQRPP